MLATAQEEQEAHSDGDEPTILFVSLGMFIIDTIIDAAGKQLDNVVGGAGTFAAVGSRLFTKENETGFIVDYGSDVPASVEDTLSSLGLALDVRRNADRQCTRGLNTYRGDLRLFEYLTPKIRITPDQLSRRFLASRSFHLICAPERCIAITEELHNLRTQARVLERPWIIWEPVPDSCTPNNREAFARAVKCVHVVSPNADEAKSLLSRDTQRSRNAERAQIESLAAELSNMGIATVVLRCSAEGAYIHAEELKSWYPAFVTDAAQVIDATGAGNTFCGAFVTRLAQSASMHNAMCCAAVAAALSIQQVGLPVLVKTKKADSWNGHDVVMLVNSYETRLNISDECT